MLPPPVSSQSQWPLAASGRGSGTYSPSRGRYLERSEQKQLRRRLARGAIPQFSRSHQQDSASILAGSFLADWVIRGSFHLIHPLALTTAASLISEQASNKSRPTSPTTNRRHPPRAFTRYLACHFYLSLLSSLVWKKLPSTSFKVSDGRVVTPPLVLPDFRLLRPC